jgi:hypothetical protein
MLENDLITATNGHSPTCPAHVAFDGTRAINRLLPGDLDIRHVVVDASKTMWPRVTRSGPIDRIRCSLSQGSVPVRPSRCAGDRHRAQKHVRPAPPAGSAPRCSGRWYNDRRVGRFRLRSIRGSPMSGASVTALIEHNQYACEPDEQASEWVVAAGIHSLARLARKESTRSPRAARAFGGLNGRPGFFITFAACIPLSLTLPREGEGNQSKALLPGGGGNPDAPESGLVGGRTTATETMAWCFDPARRIAQAH